MQTPSQIAKKANVNAQTIRNWSEEYADVLPRTERAASGTRLFTDEAAEILLTIAALRRADIPASEIRAQLHNEQMPPIIDVVPTPLNEASNVPQITPQPLDSHLAAYQITLKSHQSHIDTLAQDMAQIKAWQAERDKDAIYRAERRGSTITLAVIGFLWLVAWLYTNGAPW